MRSHLAISLALLLCALLASAAARPTPSAAQPPSRIYLPALSTEDFAKQVLDLVNDQRALAGCAPLTIDVRLNAAGAAHSQDMADNNFFDHQGSDGSHVWNRVEREGYSWTRIGENIAAGQERPAQVMSDWMASSNHRANILNCNYTHMGLGYIYQHDDEPLPGDDAPLFYYWAQVFATPQE